MRKLPSLTEIEHMSSFRTNAESLPDFRMRFPSLSSG